jgi:PEP-CTERM motif
MTTTGLVHAGDYLVFTLNYNSALPGNLVDQQTFVFPQSWSPQWDLPNGTQDTSVPVLSSGNFDSWCNSNNGNCNYQPGIQLWTNATGEITGWDLAVTDSVSKVYASYNSGGLGGGSEYDQIGGLGSGGQQVSITSGGSASWTETIGGVTQWKESFGTPVPEPASIVLLIAMLSAVGIYKRKRTA